jgi:hypothetical protein
MPPFRMTQDIGQVLTGGPHPDQPKLWDTNPDSQNPEKAGLRPINKDTSLPQNRGGLLPSTTVADGGCGGSRGF